MRSAVVDILAQRILKYKIVFMRFDDIFSNAEVMDRQMKDENHES
jgi:hypothetical protein